MATKWNLLILALHFSLLTVMSVSSCEQGYITKKGECIDQDECDPDDIPVCGTNTVCVNTFGSFYCKCADGYRSTGNGTFTGTDSTECKDINECSDNKDTCGPNTRCVNTIGSFYCKCDDGFISTTGVENFTNSDNVTCRDINECSDNKDTCGPNARCVNTIGSFYCKCDDGFISTTGVENFTNSDNVTSKCTFSGNKEQYKELNCDVFKDINYLKETFLATSDRKQLKQICLELKKNGSLTAGLDGDHLLERLLYAIDKLLSSGTIKNNTKVSTFLDTVETVLGFMGPFINSTKRSSIHTELEMVVRTGADIPQGPVTLSTKQAQMNILLETAAGDPSYYPGFTTLSLLSYSNLENSADGFFVGMKPQKNQRLKINSKVVTVTVSNRNTSILKVPVNLTFYHLNQTNESFCAYWDSSQDGGTWSARGCSVVEFNPNYTVCSCTHLSSFAVLMSLYEMENKFELQLITWVGLSLSQICLFICILTFSLIRSIQSTRNTIHLHLCISLFTANLIFLAGISHTENQVGCAVVAGLLHFLYLAVFCWMCLEGIQLFRMVVLVFNTTFKTLYMMAGGYGVPAVIVTVSALINPKGYGTTRHCWLNLDFIWSFFGPACIIIIINIFFFLITVWKLAQKFSSLNPDLDKLQKIKAFTITAVAQLCVLGTMWIFGCFQFEEGTIVMSYLFTIFGSLQGVLLFVMHCLFSKQVREEYEHFLSRFSEPQKKSYSEFSSSHSSKAHRSRSTQETGESHI